MWRRHLLCGVSARAIAAPLAITTMILLSAEDASAQTVISGNQTTPVIDNTGSVIVQSGASVNTGTPTAIQLNLTGSTLTNSGTIANNNGVSSGITVNATVFFLNSNGSLVNNGTIVNQFPLIASSDGTPPDAVLGNGTFSSVVNNGTIEAARSAIEVNEGVTGNFINGATGRMISTQGTAVVFGTTDVPTGVAIGGNFENDGAIQSAFGYGAILVGSVGGSVTNTGTINVTVSEARAAGRTCNGHSPGAGACATGIFIFGTVSGNVVNTGTVTASGATVPNNDLFGSGIIVGAVDGNIVNSGTITGNNGYGIAVGRTAGSPATSGVIVTAGNVGGSIVNTGTITSGMTGILVGNVGGAVTNAGTIASSGGYGVYVGGSVAAGIANSGLISGVTGLYIGGAGANVFDSGTITGSGGTAIQFGGTGNTLTLAPGFAINGNVLGSGGDTLQLGGSGSGVFNAGAIGMQYQGFSAFNKIGPSTWTLTGTGSYSGPTTVAAGALIVDGSIANSAVTVNGGTLAGSGAVGNAVINNGATLMPGNGSPGTFLTVNGSLALQSGALYLVPLNFTASSLASVTGTAALAGTVQVTSPANSYRFNSPYTILTSGGLGGSTFNALTTPTGIAGSLSYTGNNVLLDLNPALGQIPGSANQKAVGMALDAAFNAAGGANGPISAIFAGNVAQNVAQLSGETATGTQQTTFDAMSLFLSVMTDPFVDGRGGASNPATGAPALADEGNRASFYAATKRIDAYAMFTKAPPAAAFEPRWSVWAAGFGGSEATDGNAALGSNRATSRIYGTAAGADYLISPNTIAGFALAGGGTNFSVANGGTGRSDLFQAGAFVRHSAGPAYISAALAYGWQDVTTNRTVTVAGIDQLQARFDANAYSGRVEGGYRLVAPWVGGIGITPYTAAQFTTFDLPAYAEQALSGANTFALAYASRSVTDTRSELGIRTDKSFAMQNAILTLRGRVAWAHDFDPDRSIAATFQALPGASFVVNGAAQASDAALTTASAELKWTNGWSVAASFEGEFSDVTTSYAGKGLVRYAW